MKAVPVLQTNRCTLSAVTQEDILNLRQILDDADTQRFLPELCLEFQTIKSLQQFILCFDIYLQKDNGILWGIRNIDTLIGFVAIMDMQENATLFYAMHPKYRNRGLTSECVAEVARFYHSCNYPGKLQSVVYNNNMQSLYILKKNGFAVIGQQGQKKVMRKIE